MAISDAQKVDLLYKKYFGVAKTDTSGNKGAGNEAIPSSVFVRNDKLWYQSQNIPAVAANVVGIVRPWLGTERIALAADTTTTPVSNVFPTWKANLVNWIPPEFGATYAVKIYAENGGNVDPSGNTSLSDSGIGGVGEWNFDYQSGVLNFIGGTIPAVLTGSLNQTKVLYLTGYQYIGSVGAPATSDIVANIANIALSISNISQSVSQITNRLNANTITTDVITANTWNKLYTANVIETAGNLYFTNTRARASLSAGTGVYYDANTGTISIGQDVSTTANVTFNNLIVTNNLTVYGGVENIQANNLVVSDNMIYLNSGSINSNPDIGFAFNYNDGTYHHGGFFRDHSDGTFKVFENYQPEPDANIFINTSHASFRIANLAATTFFGNVSGTVGSLSNHNTTDLAEGTNLYFTNARVASNVITLMKSFQGSGLTIDAANGQINIIASAGGNANVANTVISLAGHTTSEIAEGNNLYYTNARVLAYASNLSINVFADVDITGIQNNGILIWDGSKFAAGTVSASATSNTSLFSYLAAFANTSGVSNVSYLANVANSVLSLAGHTTSEIAEGSNLYFTYARVNTAVQPFLTTANVVETSSNLYYTNARVNVFIQQFFTTANVRELGNLYYTDARVNTAVRPMLTTANVIETSANLYFTNARVLASLYNADLTLGNLSTSTFATSIFVANTITANTLTISGNATIGSGVGGTLSGLSYLYSTNVIANALFVSNIVLQNTDVTQQILGIGASNVIYSISAEQSNVNYSANIKLTGTNAITGNVSIQDQVSFKGTGLVRVTRQDADTIVINAGVAPVVATPVANTATEITRFSKNLYRTAEFIYTSNTSSYTNPSYAGLYNAGKILLLHDGSSVIFTQYAILQTGNGLELAAFSATINSGNVILYATAADGVTATVKLSGTTYTEI